MTRGQVESNPFSRTPQTSDSGLIFDQVELPSTEPFT
jgi:hypothetical protein